ncbi:UmuC protein [Streptomyces sp. NBRC 110611]|nr:UmuC protein [Streptomyces sp. NBRC 110611]
MLEDPPGLQAGDASLHGIPESSVGSVHRPLMRVEVLPWPAAVGHGEGAAGTEVSQVRQDRDAEPDAGADDAVAAGRGQVVGAAGQGP